MRIYYSKVAWYKDEPKPLIGRQSFGDDCKLSVFDFLLTWLPDFVMTCSKVIRRLYVNEGSIRQFKIILTFKL